MINVDVVNGLWDMGGRLNCMVRKYFARCMGVLNYISVYGWQLMVMIVLIY